MKWKVLLWSVILSLLFMPFRSEYTVVYSWRRLSLSPKHFLRAYHLLGIQSNAGDTRRNKTGGWLSEILREWQEC